MPFLEEKHKCLKLLTNISNKLKEFYHKTIEYAIFNDFVDYLYDELMSQNFEEEVKKIRSCMNDITETEHFEILNLKKTEFINRITMLGENLENILLGISYIEMRQKKNPGSFLINNYADMDENEKFLHMLILVQQNLGFQVASDN